MAWLNMSDQGMPDFQSLYQQVLQGYPHGKTPAADMKAAIAWKAMIDKELGFDPTNYEAPAKKAWSPKNSVVRTQYASDPTVTEALDKVDSGVPSSTIASVLIDPSTGEVAPDALAQGYTTASATAAVKAAQDYEKEKATNTVDQQDYQNRQDADPTFGRTQGSTGGKQVLPDGSLTGTEKPDFSYSQGIMDMLQGLSTSPDQVSMPMAAPRVSSVAPGSKYGPRRTDAAAPAMAQDPSTPPTGPMSPPSASIPPISVAPVNMLGDNGSPYHAARDTSGGGGFNSMMQGIQHLIPHLSASPQQRAVSGVSAMQDFANKYATPVRSQANNAAVQKLMQIIALQG